MNNNFSFSAIKHPNCNICLRLAIAAFFLCSCHQTGSAKTNDTSSSTDTSTDTSTASSTVATNQTDLDTESATDSHATDSETTDTETETQSDTASEPAVSNPKMEITDASVAANCMPGFTDDKLLAYWTVHFLDASDDIAVFENATITVETTTDRIEQHLEVDVTEVPLSDGEGTAELRKTEGDPIPSDVLLCVTLCKEATYTLNVVFSVGDMQISKEVSGKFLCTS